MSMHHDPELDDVLQDDELLRLAGMLRSTARREPPLDDAFRSALRRQLMSKAWEMSEGRTPWWRRSAAPRRRPVFAWAVAAVGVVLIASVVVFSANQQPGTLDITSPIAGAHAVQLQSPILVDFNQPMDHQSTEAAVQIAPATNVTFSWQGNTLAVQPTSGDLAPNTQYQVTIGAGARTQSGRELLANPKVITFVTQPPATPRPTPRPTAPPTPTSQLASEHMVIALPPGTYYAPQWSADSTTIYIVGDNGALESVDVSSGAATVLVPDGVSRPTVSPAGGRIAYVRGGTIEIVNVHNGPPVQGVATGRVTAMSWVSTQLFWATGAGIFKLGGANQVQVAAIPPGAVVLSIAPDGGHAVYQQRQSLSVIDLGSSSATPFGQAGSAFLGWSPDGSRMLYTTGGGNVVADDLGTTLATIPAGDPSWSSQGQILLGSATGLDAVNPDGSGLTRLSNGTYRLPNWAPNATAFAFVRNNAIWVATTATTTTPPQSNDLQDAAATVTAFMNARQNGQLALAATYLDNNARQEYGSALPLLIRGDARFSRYYIVTQEITSRHPATARFVVRLVLTRGSIDRSDFEETLTLVRAQPGGPFLIDDATGGHTRDLGTGAEVVSVDVASGTVKIVFDSDLVPSSVTDGVIVLDRAGKRVGGSSTYSNRTVIITGLELAPGASYVLRVLTNVQDVSGRNVAAEYDLNLVGPDAGTTSTGDQGSAGVPQQPSGGGRQSPSPVTSPTP